MKALTTTIEEEAARFKEAREQTTQDIIEDNAVLVPHVDIGYAYTVGRMDNGEAEILVYGYSDSMYDVYKEALDLLESDQILSGDWFSASNLYSDPECTIKAQIRFEYIKTTDAELVMMPSAVYRYGYLKLLERGVLVLDLRNPSAEVTPAPEVGDGG